MNPMKMMKQFQEMQARLEKELDQLSVTASSGGEMVTVTMNGRKELQSIKIDKQVIDPADPEMLQDLIVAALAECGRKVDETVAAKVSNLGGGLKLPGF